MGKKQSAGQVMAVFALMMVFLIGIAGITIDSSGAFDKTRRDQNIADAAALAASLYIYANGLDTSFTGAATAAATIESDDGCTSPCSVALTYLDSSDDIASSPSTTYKVQAVVSDSYSYWLMDAIVGSSSTSFTRTAVAKVGNGQLGLQIGYPIPCQICLLGSSGYDLQITSNGVTLQSSTGSFDINADAEVTGASGDIVQVTGTGNNVNVHGTVNNPHSQTISPLVNPSSTITDPLVNETLPSTSGTNFGSPVDTGTGLTLTPGVYGTVQLAGTGETLNFSQPGTYVFAGGSGSGLILNKTGTIVTGTGVTLYFTCGTSAAPTPCASGQQGAGIQFTGNNSQFNVASPTTGTWFNILLFYDRNNTSAVNFSGNSITGTASGAVYAPAASMTWGGNSGALSAVAPIIASQLIVTGNGFNAGGIARAGQQPTPGGLIQ